MSEIFRIDGIKWWITKNQKNGRMAIALCPDHNLRLYPMLGRIRGSSGSMRDEFEHEATTLQCGDGPHNFEIPKRYAQEKQYVIDKIDAKVFKDLPVIDIDGELTPIAKEKIKSKDQKYFVTAQLMQSKRGLQVVIYAGEKGTDKKTQIFVEPEVKRLAFDHTNLNPNDVFVELKATFDDGSSHTMHQAPKNDPKDAKTSDE